MVRRRVLKAQYDQIIKDLSEVPAQLLADEVEATEKGEASE